MASAERLQSKLRAQEIATKHRRRLPDSDSDDIESEVDEPSSTGKLQKQADAKAAEKAAARAFVDPRPTSELSQEEEDPILDADSTEDKHTYKHSKKYRLGPAAAELAANADEQPLEGLTTTQR